MRRQCNETCSCTPACRWPRLLPVVCPPRRRPYRQPGGAARRRGWHARTRAAHCPAIMCGLSPSGLGLSAAAWAPNHTTRRPRIAGGGGVCALSPAPSRRRRRQCVTRAALNYFYWGNISGVPGSGATCKSWCAARCMEWEALASAWCGGRQTKASTKRRAPPGSSSSVRYTGRVEPRPAALAPHGARSPPQQHERESAKPLRHTLKGRERMACTGNKPCRRP
jgi:hypothetical protein